MIHVPLIWNLRAEASWFGASRRAAMSAIRLARNTTGEPPRPVSAHAEATVNGTDCGRTGHLPRGRPILRERCWGAECWRHPHPDGADETPGTAGEPS